MEANITESEQVAIEQEALDTLARSRQTIQEQVSGETDEIPEGYNQDGTPIEDNVDEPILGKFQSQDDLIKAYQELEKKLGDNKSEEQPPPTTDVEDKEVINKDGESFNVTKFDDEFRNNGELSEDSYKELEKNGFGKAEVDRYIAGQQALVKQYTETIYSTAGGEENYVALINWASDNLPPATVEEYNEALSGGKLDKVQQLLEYMTFKAGNTAPKQPTRLTPTSTSEGTGLKPFGDKSEWQKATANPIYGRDAKYTNMVDKRYLAAKGKGLI